MIILLKVIKNAWQFHFPPKCIPRKCKFTPRFKHKTWKHIGKQHITSKKAQIDINTYHIFVHVLRGPEEPNGLNINAQTSTIERKSFQTMLNLKILRLGSWVSGFGSKVLGLRPQPQVSSLVSAGCAKRRQSAAALVANTACEKIKLRTKR